MNKVTNMLNRALAAYGLRLTRSRRPAAGGPYSSLFQQRRVADLEGLAAAAAAIPGMLTEESGKLLFALCYTQQLDGDVVEIGSWQGYSTSFLARAVLESGNGRLYAIDHFRGNTGKENHYVVGAPDLSDLPRRFQDNMRRLGLDQAVRLLAMPNREAAERLRNEGARVRFLFIDGDHTREGVLRDVELFFPFLMKGSIVVFDDCSPSAPGVVEVIDDLLQRKRLGKAFAYPNSLVAVLS
jgi:predicted O-methyltransferase YrrM